MEPKTYHDYIQLNKEIDRLYHEVAVALGLSDSALALLFTLWEEGDGLTPSQLCAQWSMSKQTGHSGGPGAGPPGARQRGPPEQGGEPHPPGLRLRPEDGGPARPGGGGRLRGPDPGGAGGPADPHWENVM